VEDKKYKVVKEEVKPVERSRRRETRRLRGTRNHPVRTARRRSETKEREEESR